jgi:hypothetical protein
VGLAGAVILGAFFRLVWGMDIEYKRDEILIFQQTQEVGRTESFPWLGMRSSVMLRNPGMSVWVFLLLAKLFGAQDPPALARGVQILNLGAIGLLTLFAIRVVPTQEREPWLWAVALASVNPLAVLFQRKIWPPSVLPILTMLFLLGWWHRQRGWGAFLWGVVGACLGQIEMAKFFFSAGFVAWAMLFDRKRVAWVGWLGGSVVGTLPLIPWFGYLFTEIGNRPIPMKWSRLFEFKFWTHWATEPFGIGLKYALGENFADFIASPVIQGRATYFVGLLHLLIVLLAAAAFVRASCLLWRGRQSWRDLLIGRDSNTALTLNAAVLGFGVLLTASGLPFHRHYLVGTFPLMYVWLARIVLDPPEKHPKGAKAARALLGAVCVLEALLSAAFLSYIHVSHGASHGGYGIAYGAQEGAIRLRVRDD